MWQSSLPAVLAFAGGVWSRAGGISFRNPFRYAAHNPALHLKRNASCVEQIADFIWCLPSANHLIEHLVHQRAHCVVVAPIAVVIVVIGLCRRSAAGAAIKRAAKARLVHGLLLVLGSLSAWAGAAVALSCAAAGVADGLHCSAQAAAGRRRHLPLTAAAQAQHFTG